MHISWKWPVEGGRLYTMMNRYRKDLNLASKWYSVKNESDYMTLRFGQH